MGSGQSALRNVCLGYNRSSDSAHSLLVETDGTLNVKLSENPTVNIKANRVDNSANTELKCSSDGRLLVELEAGVLNLGNVIVKGNDGSDGSGTARTLLTNANGGAVIDGTVQLKGNSATDGSGSDNQMIVSSDGHLHTTNSNQLPASLGQKADTASLSICRDSTTGSYDLSGRTTIGTPGTSTRLLCSSSGILNVSKGHRTTDNTHVAGNTLLASTGVGVGLGATTDTIRFSMTAATSLSNITIQGSIDNSNWVSVAECDFNSYTSTNLQFSSVLVKTAFPYMRVFNGNTAASAALTSLIMVYGSDM